MTRYLFFCSASSRGRTVTDTRAFETLIAEPLVGGTRDQSK